MSGYVIGSKKIVRAMILAFCVVSVLAAGIIWFSFDTTSMVRAQSGALINRDIPRLQTIDNLKSLLSSHVAHLNAYYATTEQLEYHYLKTEQNQYSAMLETLGDKADKAGEFTARVEAFRFFAWQFDQEMQGQRDWDRLREHLADARQNAAEASEILTSWRESILADTRSSSESSLNEVARLSILLLVISAAIVSASAIVLFLLYNRLKDSDTLYRLAYFEPLTGLPNTVRLTQVLDAEIDRGEQGFLVQVQLNRAQLLYATLGPDIADKARITVSGWIELCAAEISPEIGVYQTNKDQWTLCDRRGQNEVSLRALLDALLELEKKQVNVGSVSVNASFQIGIVRYPQDGMKTRDLHRNAIAAIQETSVRGGDWCFYDQEMSRRYQQWLETDVAIREALQNDEFELFYQPKVNSVTGQIASAEALIRWQRNGKWISPGEFIPVAESSGLIIPLGAWVLEAVCRQIQQWQQRGVPLFPIALNISAQQYQDESFVPLVAKIIKQYGIAPEMLELEITEEVAANDPEYVIETMQRLKKIGVRIALDDFGTGYSSLSYLKRFPIDTMKIDRSFIAEMGHSSQSVAIVDLILALANRLGFTTVAEGVETMVQAEALKQKQCPLLQGFLFSRPVPPQQFEKLLGQTHYPEVSNE